MSSNPTEGLAQHQPSEEVTDGQDTIDRSTALALGSHGLERYEQPCMTVLGTASALTHGGYYNDYDSPGVRMTRG